MPWCGRRTRVSLSLCGTGASRGRNAFPAAPSCRSDGSRSSGSRCSRPATSRRTSAPPRRCSATGQEVNVSGWIAWEQKLDALCPVYQKPPRACGMVTDAELCLVETYARHSFTGAGKIVELGCWQGAITVALARGLANNPGGPWKRPIESFDRFLWEPWMTPIAERLGCARVADGESFFHLTQANVAPYAHLVSLRQKDLLEPIRFAHPIEFLFVDAMKSWDLANAIVRTFFAKLIPALSLVVHQDYGYFGPIVGPNHILMWLMRAYFMPLYHLPRPSRATLHPPPPPDTPVPPRLDKECLTP